MSKLENVGSWSSPGDQRGVRCYWRKHLVTSNYPPLAINLEVESSCFYRASSTRSVWNRGGIPGFVLQQVGFDPTFNRLKVDLRLAGLGVKRL